MLDVAWLFLITLEDFDSEVHVISASLHVLENMLLAIGALLVVCGLSKLAGKSRVTKKKRRSRPKRRYNTQDFAAFADSMDMAFSEIRRGLWVCSPAECYARVSGFGEVIAARWKKACTSDFRWTFAHRWATVATTAMLAAATVPLRRRRNRHKSNAATSILRHDYKAMLVPDSYWFEESDSENSNDDGDRDDDDDDDDDADDDDDENEDNERAKEGADVLAERLSHVAACMEPQDVRIMWAAYDNLKMF